MRAVVTMILVFSFLSIFADSFEDYYPLSVGDYWIQHSEISNGGIDPITFNMENEAIDQINGLDYVRKLNHLAWDDGSDEATWYVWLRATDEGAMLGGFGSSTNINEATIFDPPILWFPDDMATLGNTYEVVIPEMGGTFFFITNGVGETVTVPAGTFDSCIVIGLTIRDSTQTITQETEYYFAYHVGEVRNYSWNEWYDYSELELTEYYVQAGSNQNEIPISDYNLSNYPNPFNPSTTISFNVPQTSSSVNMEIYNLKGQLIKTMPVILSGVEGQTTITWNGENDNEHSVSSGLYFYSLIINGFPVQTRKMLLMK
ncbi:FlgD immunoglobulin-like domain containing protein [Candidatus Cloacimonadota bacterium]